MPCVASMRRSAVKMTLEEAKYSPAMTPHDADTWYNARYPQNSRNYPLSMRDD